MKSKTYSDINEAKEAINSNTRDGAVVISVTATDDGVLVVYDDDHYRGYVLD